MSERFGFLEEMWKKGRANYLIEGGMKLRFAIAATIINSSEIADKRILDVGCGITYVPNYLISSFKCYHGIDVAPYAITKNDVLYKGTKNVSFSVDNIEEFRDFDKYDIILCLGYAPFSQCTSRPDIRLRGVFVSKVSPHQHKLIILEASNTPNYKAGAEDLIWMKEALLNKNFFVVYEFTFNIKSDRRHSNRHFIVFRGG